MLKVIEDGVPRDVPIQRGRHVPAAGQHDPLAAAPGRHPRPGRRAPADARTRRRRSPGTARPAATMLYQFLGVITDLGTQLKPVMEEFWSTPDLHTCKVCGAVMPPPTPRDPLSLRGPRSHRPPYAHPAAGLAGPAGTASGTAAGRSWSTTARGCARMVIDGRSFREDRRRLLGSGRPPRGLRPPRRRLQVLSTVPGHVQLLGQAGSTTRRPGAAAQRPPRRGRRATARPVRRPGHAAAAGRRTSRSRSSSAASRELGWPGVQIGTHVDGMDLDDPRIDARPRGGRRTWAPRSSSTRGTCSRPSDEPHWLPWLVGHAGGDGAGDLLVVLGGVLERLPGLRICFAHGGGSFPGHPGPHRARLPRPAGPAATVDNDGARATTVGRFYVDSLVHDADALRFVAGIVGPRPRRAGHRLPVPARRGGAGRG